MTTPRRAGKKPPPRPLSSAPPDAATLHGRRARARPTRARSLRTCRQGTSRVSSVLREPDDAEGLGDPLNDVAHLDVPDDRLVAGDEEDGVSLGVRGRLSNGRGDGRL